MGCAGAGAVPPRPAWVGPASRSAPGPPPVDPGAIFQAGAARVDPGKGVARPAARVGVEHGRGQGRDGKLRGGLGCRRRIPCQKPRIGLASRSVLESRYMSRSPVCDGDATSPPGTALIVSVLLPPAGTPAAGRPDPAKRGVPRVYVMPWMASVQAPVK